MREKDVQRLFVLPPQLIALAGLSEDFSENSSRNVGMFCRPAVLHPCVTGSFNLGERLISALHPRN
jgi:hypothetical protein